MKLSDIRYKKNKRSKHIRITVKPSGNILVSYPYFTPKFMAQRFVQKQKKWIEQQTQKIQQQKRDNTKKKNEVLYFGKVYQIKIVKNIKDFTKLNSVIFKTKYAYIYPSKFTKKHVSSILHSYLKKQAKQYIKKQTETLSKKMKISYNQIRIKEQSTRWGSSSSKKNLNFNWRLIQAPKKIIDYVIIHELAHQKHMNHSKNFWNFVEKYDPEYRIHKGWLKRKGVLLT